MREICLNHRLQRSRVSLNCESLAYEVVTLKYCMFQIFDYKGRKRRPFFKNLVLLPQGKIDVH